MTLQPYSEFHHAISRMRLELEDARSKEMDRFHNASQIQAKITELLLRLEQTGSTMDAETKEQLQQRLHVLYEDYAAAEEKWKAASLQTASVRVEIRDAIREQNGATDEEKFCGMHSLNNAKPVPFRTQDVSPERRCLIREAYPEVPPVLDANLQRIPLALHSVAQKFESLDVRQEGAITIAEAQAYFDSFGLQLPGMDKFVERSLQQLGLLAKHPLVTLDEFSLLCTKFATL